MLSLGPCPALAQERCPPPRALEFRVERTVARSETGFTQGLEVREGALLEGTGSVGGPSAVNAIDLTTGQVRRLADLGTAVFGEGLTVLKGQMFQLTWMDRKVFVRDLQGRLIREMVNRREGWGLTNDGTDLIFSDGSGSLFVADPQTFATKRVIEVRSSSPEPIRGLNELEYVDGKVYANVFGDWTILRVNLLTGCVDAYSDLQGLQDRMDPRERAQLKADSNHVLNGIAYDQESRSFYVTGKRWWTIFAGRFQERAR
jgi:glutamine cyclotransferase